MTIHYHGTALTPRSDLQKMAGKHFCVSFANPQDADWCLANGQSVMWDNGAFSFRDKGGLDPDAFMRWVAPRLAHPHWCVIPDVIGGDEITQRSLVDGWPLRPELSAPVWHMDLSIDWLIELADRFPKICFGSTKQYWQVGSDAWERRADEAFNAIAKRGRLPWVHMLRGMAMCGDRWPFASVDSVNVARNFKTANVCPERMARRIDAVQCPVAWSVRPQQPDMFSEVAAI